MWEPGAASVAALDLELGKNATEEEWLYRITYFPEEYVSGTEEIVVEFGPTAMTIDGESYVLGEGVSYDTILQWARDQYDYWSVQD